MNPITDLYLMHRARAGDRRAFDALFDRHSARVYNLLRRLSNDRALAEDLAQETFVQAFGSLATWQGVGNVSSWFCGIAVRRHRNAVRRHSAERLGDSASVPTTEDDDETERIPTSDGDPFARLSQQEASRLLESAIADLPDGCRAAFVLVYVEGFAYREAAHLLEIPTGTIQSRLNRAKRLLHTRLTTSPDAAEFFALPAAKGESYHAL